MYVNRRFGKTPSGGISRRRFVQGLMAGAVIAGLDLWRWPALAVSTRNEQTVLRSPYRQENFNGAGLTLSQNRDVIDQLPAGRYVSLFIESYPGDPVLQAIHPDDPDWVSYFSAYEFSSVIYLDIVP